MLRRFEVRRASAVAEAIELRRRFGSDAAVYAGGTELLMAMKLGLARWPVLIDVKPIPELREMDVADGILRIGAAVTHARIERDPVVVRALPVLARMEHALANVRVRAAGTLGGNLAFAEPHADPPTLLAALGARVVLHGASGERVVPAARLAAGMYQTDIREDEILVRLDIPIPRPAVRAAYVKFQILERPSVGVAVVGAVRDGRFAEAPSVFVGAVDEVPRRVPTTELQGAAIAAQSTRDALAEAARGAVEPIPDLAGSAEYKRHLVGVFASRALSALAEAA